MKYQTDIVLDIAYHLNENFKRQVAQPGIYNKHSCAGLA